MIWACVVFCVAGLVPIWAVIIYNTLVRLKQHCRESWSDIDTELRRRYDLIPNLVATVRDFAAHEEEVLERVVQARNVAAASTGSASDQARDENALIGAMRQLFAVAEGYPELKSGRNFLQLQQELSNTEDRIQAARRFYNANVRDLNTRIRVFPSNLVAGAMHCRPEEFFEIQDASVRALPQVDLGAPAEPPPAT